MSSKNLIEIFFLTLLLNFYSLVNGSCPNNCNGKGVCDINNLYNGTFYCKCQSNYFGPDCSQCI